MNVPRFKVGEIIRYGDGETALMRIATISPNHGGRGMHRYYGQQCMGGSNGTYECHCQLASFADRAVWAAIGRRTDIHGRALRTPWRVFFKRYANNRNLIGMVED